MSQEWTTIYRLRDDGERVRTLQEASLNRPDFGLAVTDGLIGSDGLVQFKCVKTAKHLEYIMSNLVPVEHRGQMYFEMACTGRQWSDFCSYDPNLPEHFQLFIARLKRDETEIAELENEVRKFNAEVDEILAKLSARSDDEYLTAILGESIRQRQAQ